MPSSYSPNLRVELIANGEQTGTWGSTTNVNLGTLIESAISGYVSVTVSGDMFLQALNGVADQARNMCVELAGSPAGAFTIYIPPAEKLYIIFNNTGQAATIAAATAVNSTNPTGGSTIVIPAGKTTAVTCDASDVKTALDHVNSDFSVSGTAAVGGTLVVTGAMSAASATLGAPLSVANGGTGVTSITAGTIPRGNGTGALSPASAADIVANIGSTAVTNSTNTTNILGGGANRIPYNTGTSATTFLAAPTTSEQFLKYNGTSLVWAELPASGVLSVTATPPLENTGTTANPVIAITGTVGATNGGTGVSSYATGDILYANSSTTLTKLTAGSNGTFLRSNGAGSAPSWATPSTGITSFTINAGTSMTGGGTISTSGGSVTLSVNTGGIAAAQLASNAVTTAKILDGNVTAAKIENVTGTGNQSLSANGYQKLPGGVLIQWGVASRTGATTTVSFPVAFGAGKCYSITITSYTAGSSGGQPDTPVLTTLPSTVTSSFTISCPNAQTEYSWMAIGSYV